MTTYINHCATCDDPIAEGVDICGRHPGAAVYLKQGEPLTGAVHITRFEKRVEQAGPLDVTVLAASEASAPDAVWFVVQDGQLMAGPYFKADRAENGVKRLLEDGDGVGVVVRYVRVQ